MTSTVDLATQTIKIAASTSTVIHLADGSNSLYGFVPSRSANLAGVVLFAILWGYHTVVGIWYRQWWMLVAWFCGLGLECAGYIGRYVSGNDPYVLNDFLVQIICLTLAPAFLMVSVYYQLAKIITVISEDVSPVKPMMYAAIFAVCDLVSIVIQAAGGGMAAGAFQDGTDTDSGTHVMVAGMAWQVFSMAVFIIMAFFVFWKTWKVTKRHNAFVHNPEFNSQYIGIRGHKLFFWYVGSIAFCTLCIFIRCIYRVCELAEGWSGYLIVHERYFLVLDGLMVFLGCLGMTIVHPGFVLGKEVIAVKGLHKKSPGSEADSEKNVVAPDEQYYEPEQN